MDIRVSGKNIKVGQTLNSHISERLQSTADKYFENSIDAAVTLSKEGPFFHVECRLHPIPGVSLHSHADGMDIYGSFEDAAQKLEKQLRRFKRKIKNHHDSSREVEIL